MSQRGLESPSLNLVPIVDGGNSWHNFFDGLLDQELTILCQDKHPSLLNANLLLLDQRKGELLRIS